jgi:ATP-dependent Lon protease
MKKNKRFEISYNDAIYKWDKSFINFKTTEEVKRTKEIIGQERAVEAIKLGLGLDGMGYNIFVTGLSGTGRTTTIQMMVSKIASKQENPGDWCYVYNFEDPNSPKALHLGPGEGTKLEQAMDRLVETLKVILPSVITSDNFQNAKKELGEKFKEKEKKIASRFENLLKEKGFTVVQVQMGMGTKPIPMPLVKGKVVDINEIEKLKDEGILKEEEVKKIIKSYEELALQLEETLRELKEIQNEFEKQLKILTYNVFKPILNQFFTELKMQFSQEEVKEYFEEVQKNILQNPEPFLSSEDEKEKKKKDLFLPYKVNVIVDNKTTKGRPIIIEHNPSYVNLFGTIERTFEDRFTSKSDFMQIRAGSLHKANGGYLVVNFNDLIQEPGVWHSLKRALRNEKLYIFPEDNYFFAPPSPLRPEPIDLKVKVILIGDIATYQLAYYLDEDFKKIFKVLSEFDSSMDCTKENFSSFVQLMGKIIDEENLKNFTAEAVLKVAEYAMKLAGRKGKLSTRFDAVADIMREAHYWAKEEKKELVDEKNVVKAIRERERRHSLADDKIKEMILQNILNIETEGKRVGQVNGLTVYDFGYYSFGKPVKITADVSLGQDSIISIEREADLAGNIFTKGSLIIAGFLRQTFTKDKPLSINASICFEQSYGEIEGDSATCAEFYALLSAISSVPARQDVAVTGSMNQKGLVQAVGGINEKIEGFFNLVKEKGIKGTEGVIIPKANLGDLILKEDVLKEMKEGRFHIWAIEDITEGVEILFGIPAGKRKSDGKFTKGSLFEKVDNALQENSKIWKKYK